MWYHEIRIINTHYLSLSVAICVISGDSAGSLVVISPPLVPGEFKVT